MDTEVNHDEARYERLRTRSIMSYVAWALKRSSHSKVDDHDNEKQSAQAESL